MDRDALQRFLRSPHRTFRWNQGEDGEYGAVETTDAGLIWFRWVQSGLGREDQVEQTYEAYHRDGALRPMPEEVASQLAEWVSEHRPG